MRADVHLAVVPAGDVKRPVVAARISRREAAADSDWARVVLIQHDAAEAGAALGRRAEGDRASPVLLPRRRRLSGRDLVADRPDEDGRVVAVAADELHELARHELLQRDVAAPAGGVPLVERLVPDEEAHLVAEVQHLRRGRVVRHADRVRAHVAHDGELAARRVHVERHPERAEVAVQVDAVELHPLAVEEEAAVRVEAELAEADPPHERVREAVAREAQLERIELRSVLQLPELRIPNLERKVEVAASAGVDLDLVVRVVHDLPVRPAQDGRDLRLGVREEAALDRAGDRHLRLAGQHVVRLDPQGVRVEMHLVRRDEADVAVDARARIPARGVVERVDLDRHRVRPREEVGRRLRDEAEVAVVAVSAWLSVHEDRRARHHAVKLEEDASLRLLREDERLAVRAPALPRQAPDVAAVLHVKRPGDRPVVRHGDARERLAVAGELPARVEVLDRPRRRGCRNGQGRRQRHQFSSRHVSCPLRDMLDNLFFERTLYHIAESYGVRPARTPARVKSNGWKPSANAGESGLRRKSKRRGVPIRDCARPTRQCERVFHGLSSSPPFLTCHCRKTYSLVAPRYHNPVRHVNFPRDAQNYKIRSDLIL